MELSELVQHIQGGEAKRMQDLCERFLPLIFNWLKRTGELYGKDKEDFESMAKILLLEAVKEWDPTRNVPFQSFYKIKLWNWYGNYRRKKKIETVALTDHMGKEQGEFYHLEDNEQINSFYNVIGTLSEDEQKIIVWYCSGFTIEQIAKKMNVTPKKVSQIKYVAVQKIKKMV